MKQSLFNSKITNNVSIGGFTLLEVLLSISVIGLIAGVSSPFLLSAQRSNDLQMSTENVVMALRNAQTKAAASVNDSNWGVHLSSGTLTVFNGADYATRNSTYDDTTSSPSTIIYGGNTDVVFSKVNGLPTSNASISVANGNDSKVISVNSEGRIDY